MTEEITEDVVFAKDELSLVKYSIRDMADGETSPIEKAKYWTEQLMPDTRLMPAMYDNMTLENPLSEEELLDLFEGQRATLNRTENEQLQLVLMAMSMRVAATRGPKKLEEIEELLDGAQEKLEKAHGEIWERLPDEQTEEESDETAKDTIAGLTDMDREELDEVLDEE